MKTNKLLLLFYFFTGMLLILGTFFIINSMSSITGFAVLQEEGESTDILQITAGFLMVSLTIALIMFVNNAKK